MIIRYIFQLPEDEVHEFEVDLERKHDTTVDNAEHPAWTRLDFHKCENCPLSSNDYQHCPTAVDLTDVIEKFSDVRSCTNVSVWVETDDRTYYKETDLQSGLDALIGLVMATSGCPHLGKLKSLARTHLPFASFFEHIFRTIGNYLIKQYFAKLDGEKPDWTLRGLQEFYEQLEIVNSDFSDRVREASKKDAGVNALIQLSALSITVSASLEEQLDEFKKEYLG